MTVQLKQLWKKFQEIANDVYGGYTILKMRDYWHISYGIIDDPLQSLEHMAKSKDMIDAISTCIEYDVNATDIAVKLMEDY